MRDKRALPRQSFLRRCDRLGPLIPEAEIDDVVRTSMWFSEYIPAVPRDAESEE